MPDRALQVCVGLSLAIHVIASVGLSGERSATPILPPPAAAPPVRVRLAGPPGESTRAETPRPDASAAPPRPVSAPSPPEEVHADPPPPEPSVAVIDESVLPEPAVEVAAAEPISTELAALAVKDGSSMEQVDGGASSASAPDGPPGPGTADETEEERLARYVEVIRARVQDRKRYPPLARKRSVEGRVFARVAIRADGSLAEVEFAGDAPPLLRRATDEAIRSAAPYPAPPAGAITIELPVEYSLRDAS